ncbi:hypothetical protein [Sphingomonas sp. PB2P12]|uniref:hypothetical protein n=1 Tax=Sphingomonas sandaracina TaxID=3096157 RepID=UPI002FC6D27D
MAAAIAVGTAGFLLGRESVPLSVPVAAVAPKTITPAPSPQPTEAAATVLGRADLLALANAAADAFASGKAVPGDVGSAAGRQFDLVLPFGCAGPNDPAATAMGWQYDAGTGTLRVSVTPVTWSGADWHVRQGDEAATATGFWINRPWSSNERCPERVGEAAPTGTEPVTLPGQALAIATFGANGALGHEGRAFETVQRVPEFDGSLGFRLRITGRLNRAVSGGPVRCVQPASVEQRPICVIAATMDEVRIENPATRVTLATWTVGRPS